LGRAGYVEKSYYGVPGGFALATRLEQIESDGASKPAAERWVVDAPRPITFSLAEYLRALLTAAPGFYRVTVFIVTGVPFSQSDTRITGDTAIRWLADGLNMLPRSIAQQAYSQDVSCTALIYEFQWRDGRPAVLVPSRLDGLTHLRKSGIWVALGGA
jgi:hypothetical protein